MCVHPFWQDEKRILLHMNDALGGGVIAAESCTPALLSATLQKLNRLGAHEQPWDMKMLKSKLREMRARNPVYLTPAINQYEGRGPAQRFAPGNKGSAALHSASMAVLSSCMSSKAPGLKREQ